MALADHPLHPFLAPRSVAIVGVSPNWSYVNTILQQIIALGAPDRVFPVNPNYPEVAGLTSYPRLTDIPGDLDLALIAVPSRLVPDALGQCEAKGVRAVNIITSGFEEIGGEEGARRHRMLTDYVARTGSRIIGPNTYGNFSAISKFGGMPGAARAMNPGKVGLLFQSGGMAIYAVTAFADRNIGVTHCVTFGNECDLDLAESLEYLAEDDATQIVACFVEQIRNPGRFLAAAARCADLRKPIVMLKVGRSEAGQRSAQAHTGSLAGSDRIIGATLAKYGVSRVNSLEEMVETVAILHSKKMPRGRGIGALTVSGGANGKLLDLADDVGLEFPPFVPESRKIIRDVLYDYVATTNPLDITGPGIQDAAILTASLDALGSDPNMHVVLQAAAGGNGRMDAASLAGKALLAAMAKYPEKVWVRLAIVAGNYREQPLNQPPLIEPLEDLDGVPFLQGFENGLRAVAALLRYGEFQARWQAARANEHAAASDGVDDGRRERALAILRGAGAAGPTEAQGKELLALYGIATPGERLATSADEAAEAARAIGFPVVLKIVSPQITHKTEAGGVLLDVQDEAAVRAGFEQIMASARRYNPEAELQGVSVQEMVRGGRELLIGMLNDAQFGPAVVVGLGGIFVEIMQDSALRIPPLTPDDAREMVQSLKGYPLLAGARGLAHLDVDAVVATLCAFSQLCLDVQGEVAAIDINPLVVLPSGQGVRAVDCLVEMKHG